MFLCFDVSLQINTTSIFLFWLKNCNDSDYFLLFYVYVVIFNVYVFNLLRRAEEGAVT